MLSLSKYGGYGLCAQDDSALNDFILIQILFYETNPIRRSRQRKNRNYY
jgi:hypothetical protein